MSSAQIKVLRDLKRIICERYSLKDSVLMYNHILEDFMIIKQKDMKMSDHLNYLKISLGI